MKNKLIILLAFLLFSSCESYLSILESRTDCPECQLAVSFYRANEDAIRQSLTAIDTVLVPVEKECPQCPDIPEPVPCPDCPAPVVCPDCPEPVPCPDPLPCPDCPQPEPCPSLASHSYFEGLVMAHGFEVAQIAYDYTERFHGNVTGARISEGYTKNAYQFDGQSLVEIPNAPGLNPGSAITIASDFFLTAPGQSAVSNILCKASNTSGNHVYGLGVNSQNRIRFRIMRGTTTGDYFPTTVLALNTWYRVIARWNSGARATVWIKNMQTGELIRETNNVTWGGSIPVNNFNVSIGGSVHSPVNRYFNGKIDNLFLWSRSLSEKELTDWMDFEISWNDLIGMPAPSEPVAMDLSPGQSATLVARPNFGFEFVNWTINGRAFSNLREVQFTMPDSSVSLVANFRKSPLTP